jgi:phosphosulfolactate synthase (CoM biosynthesis protein A)
MRFVTKLATLITILIFVSGCSDMGAGVSIGDTKIKASKIQSIVDEMLAARKTVDTTQMDLINGKQLLRNQAQFAVVKALFDEIAKERNLLVTASDVAQRRDEINTQIGGESNLPNALVSANLAESSFNDYLRILLIVDRLNADFISKGIPESQTGSEVSRALVAMSEKLGVKVNSKYGKWNPDSAAIEEDDVTDGAVTSAP